HAGDALKPGEGLHVIDPGGLDQVALQAGDLPVVGVDQGQIDLDVGAGAFVGEARGQVQLGAVGGVGQLLGQRRQVVLAVGVDQVGQGLGAAADQMRTTPEQVAGLAHALGIDVGDGDHAAPQQDGDLVSVDLVGLGLAAVDGFHVEGVAQDEGNALSGAEVG